MEWFPIGWFRNAFHLSFLLFAGPIYINFRLMLRVLTTLATFLNEEDMNSVYSSKTHFWSVCYLNSLTLLYSPEVFTEY